MNSSRNTLKKTAAGAVFGGALLIGGGLGLAHAAPPAPEAQTAGDGLVNVTVIANNQQIGVMEGVTLANAVSLATSVCPTSLIDLPALTNLDLNGTAPVNPCNGLGGLSFTFAQNTQGGVGNVPEGVPGQSGDLGASESAPGQNRDTETTPPSAVPGTPPGQVGG